jgi:transcription initiation factor IIE alpha subunit
MSDLDSQKNSIRLACPKCGNYVTVDAQFHDRFYCHVCGQVMK